MCSHKHNIMREVKILLDLDGAHDFSVLKKSICKTKEVLEVLIVQGSRNFFEN